MGIVLTDYANYTALNALSATGGQYHNPVVGLYTNASFNPTRATQLTDLVEPTHTGYMRQTKVYDILHSNSAGDMLLQSELCTFAGPSSGSGSTVTGYFVATAGSSPVLLCCENFATPIVLNDSFDEALFSAQIKMSSRNDNGSATLIS